MDHAARLATIKALTHQGSYRINAESAECGEFVRELEAWEDTDDGKEWHEENGEEIAPVVSSFWGLGQCEDALDYDQLLELAEGYLGDLKRTDYRMTWGEPMSSKSGDYTYQVSRDLLMEESFERDGIWEVEQYLECTVKADVDSRSRTVTNVEVVQGELVHDDIPFRTYP